MVALTDQNANIVQQNAYDAWGKQRDAASMEADDTYDALTQPDLSSSSPTVTAFLTSSTATGNGDFSSRGYIGQEEIYDVGLTDLNARFYDQQIGRFLSPDPMVGQPYSTQGWNRFAYAGNNPRSRPSREDRISVTVFAIVGFAVENRRSPRHGCFSSWCSWNQGGSGLVMKKALARYLAGSRRQGD